MGDCLPGVGLTNPLFNLGQETEPLDRVLKRGTLRKFFDDLQDLLLDRIGSHGRVPPATRTLRHFSSDVNLPHHCPESGEELAGQVAGRLRITGSLPAHVVVEDAPVGSLVHIRLLKIHSVTFNPGRDPADK